MTIEELGKRFKALAGKPILSKAEQGEVRGLMRQLKEEGIGNDEISELSKGRWSASTVKGYTKGIKSSAANPWHNVVSLFDELVAADMTLDDVEAALVVSQELEEHHTGLEQVIDLLNIVDSSSIDVATLIQFHRELEQCGLSLKNVSEVLACKAELEGKGLMLESLNSLVEVAKTYGDTRQVIEAISKYGSLIELKEQIAAAKQELANLNQQVAGAHEQLEQVEAKLSQSKEPLEAYEKAAKFGFGEVQLVRLANLTQKHGGVKKVLEAVQAYTDLGDIVNKVNKAKADLASTKAEVNKLETQHAHLQTGITMCQTLIQQYKFGLDAIFTISSVAKKYGEPISVLKAVEAFGNLQAINNELAKQKGKVVGLREQIALLEGKYEEMLHNIDALQAVSLKVGAGVGKVQRQLENDRVLEKVITLINTPASANYHDHGLLVGAIAKSLDTWVTSNEKKFNSPYSIHSGLQALVKELGGT